jgi:hypothetical protein
VPVNCNVTPLSGNSGRVMFSPPGGTYCLEDFTDFPAGNRITVPATNDFQVGDKIVFSEEGSANLDSALTAGTTYYVVGGGAGHDWIQVSTTENGTPITLNGDGGVAVNGVLIGGTDGVVPSAQITAGSGYVEGEWFNVQLTTVSGTGTGARADITVDSNGAVTAVTIDKGGSGYADTDTLTADNASLGNNSPAGSGFLITLTAAMVANQRVDTEEGHIRVEHADFMVVCQVVDWSMDFSREEIDVTTLPCDCGEGSRWANFRTTIPGPASGTGSMTVLFTPDQFSTSNRLIYGSMLKDQMGATIKLYLNYVEDDSQTDECVPDDEQSMYIEAPVTLLGFSVSATTTEAMTATINFSLAGTPTHMFYTAIV